MHDAVIAEFGPDGLEGRATCKGKRKDICFRLNGFDHGVAQSYGDVFLGKAMPERIGKGHEDGVLAAGGG